MKPYIAESISLSGLILPVRKNFMLDLFCELFYTRAHSEFLPLFINNMNHTRWLMRITARRSVRLLGEVRLLVLAQEKNLTCRLFLCFPDNVKLCAMTVWSILGEKNQVSRPDRHFPSQTYQEITMSWQAWPCRCFSIDYTEGLVQDKVTSDLKSVDVWNTSAFIIE